MFVNESPGGGMVAMQCLHAEYPPLALLPIMGTQKIVYIQISHCPIIVFKEGKGLH